MGKTWAVFLGLTLVLSLDSIAAAQPNPQRDPPSSRDRILELSVIERGTNRPIAGVEIRSSSTSDGTKEFRATTDNVGRCTLPLPPREDRLAVFVIESWKEGFVPMRLRWLGGSIAAGVPAKYTLVLDPGAPIGGVVRDEEGRPVAGAKLFASFGMYGSQNRIESPSVPEKSPSVPDNCFFVSDSQGRWRSALLPAFVEAGKLAFRVEHPGFVSTRRTYDRELPIRDLRAMKAVVMLQKGFTLNGGVVNERGEGIAGATVTIWNSEDGSRRDDLFFGWTVFDARALRELESEDTTPRICQGTNASGLFRFENCVPGIAMVTVKAPGFAPGVKEVRFGPPEHEPPASLAADRPWFSVDADQLNKPGPCTPPLVFRLSKGRSIRGRVVDGSGRPVASAIVIPDVRLSGFDRLGWRGKTDADGRFVWPNAPTEAIILNVAAAGNDCLVEQLLGRGDAPADVTIPVSVRSPDATPVSNTDE